MFPCLPPTMVRGAHPPTHLPFILFPLPEKRWRGPPRTRPGFDAKTRGPRPSLLCWGEKTGETAGGKLRFLRTSFLIRGDFALLVVGERLRGSPFACGLGGLWKDSPSWVTLMGVRCGGDLFVCVSFATGMYFVSKTGSAEPPHPRHTARRPNLVGARIARPRFPHASPAGVSLLSPCVSCRTARGNRYANSFPTSA